MTATTNRTLENFVGADCKNLRTPDIDSSAIEAEIIRMAMEAWEAGKDPDSLVDRILKNRNEGSIAYEIRQQVAASNRLQRAVELKELENKKASTLQSIADAHKDSIQYAENKAKEEYELQKSKVDDAQEKVERAKKQKTAIDSRLERVRENIRNNVTSDEEAERMLRVLIINEEISQSPEDKAAIDTIQKAIGKKMKKVDGKYVLQTYEVNPKHRIGKNLLASLKYSPTNSIEDFQAYQEKRMYHNRPALVVRAAKKVWGVLTYKLW